MATERKDKIFAEFYPFTTIGQQVAGRVTRFGKNDNGVFAIFSPVLIREPGEKNWKRYSEIAVGLSANLRAKITSDKGADLGKFLQVEFRDREPSRRGKPKKIFTVHELSKDEMLELVKDSADMGKYQNPTYDDRHDDGGDEYEYTDDDLPF